MALWEHSVLGDIQAETWVKLSERGKKYLEGKHSR